MSSSWFLPSLGGLSCLAVLPSSALLGVAAFSHVFCWVVLFGFILPFGWCGCFFLLLLGGAAWFPPSLTLFSSPFAWCCLVSSLFGWSLLFGGAAFHLLLLGGVAVFPSPVWWCCLPSPPLGGVVLLGLLLLLVVLLFFLLLFGGAAFLLLLLVGLLHPPSSVGWCCFSFLLGGVVVFSFSCCVVLLGLLLPWRCFPLLLRGAAWFLPPLGGVSCLVDFVFLLLLWVGLLYPPSSVAWCCLVSSVFSVVFLSF